MVSLPSMLDINNIIGKSINGFIEDLVSSSPDLQDKLNNISPISFSIKISDFAPVYIEIAKNNTKASLKEMVDINFSISIGAMEAIAYLANKTLHKKYIHGDEEKAFVLLNTLQKSNVDIPILIERNFGHIPGVLSYLAINKANETDDVTIMPDDLTKRLRSISIRIDRLEASNNKN